MSTCDNSKEPFWLKFKFLEKHVKHRPFRMSSFCLFEKTPHEKMTKLKFQIASLRMFFFNRHFALKFCPFSRGESRPFVISLGVFFVLFYMTFCSVFFFRLFAWLFFVPLSFRVASFRCEKTKRHNPATILTGG